MKKIANVGFQYDETCGGGGGGGFTGSGRFVDSLIRCLVCILYISQQN
jgi:hypothetical protein